MQNRLKDKAIIVIGSATGIGAATMLRLAREGARVCAADFNEAGAAQIAARVRDEGGQAMSVYCDIAEEESVNAAIAACVAAFGGLDGAHINAADMQTLLVDGDVLETPLSTFDRTMAVNLRGHVLATRAVLPHLLARGGGAIVYTSSGAAYVGEPTRYSYAVAKSGLHALMRHVARRWGKEGVTANAIAPGFCITPEMRANGVTDDSPLGKAMLELAPSPRLGQVEDIAAMAAMLLSDDARWITGQVYDVNGGAVLR